MTAKSARTPLRRVKKDIMVAVKRAKRYCDSSVKYTKKEVTSKYRIKRLALTDSFPELKERRNNNSTGDEEEWYKNFLPFTEWNGLSFDEITDGGVPKENHTVSVCLDSFSFSPFHSNQKNRDKLEDILQTPSIAEHIEESFPPPQREKLRVLIETRTYAEQVSLSQGGVFYKDKGVRYFLDTLEKTDLGNIRSSSRELLLLVRALSTYKTVCLSSSTCLNIDFHRRLIAAHVVRHLWCYDIARSVNSAERLDGWTPARVLILTPTRQSCKEWVRSLVHLSSMQDADRLEDVKRFTTEFTPNEGVEKLMGPDTEYELGGSMISSGRERKPLDFTEVFRGNNDDNFKLGVLYEKGNVFLYKSFSTANIIIASPLGLRLIVGAAGEKQGEVNFLSSVEIVIVDRFDVLDAQSPEHLERVLQLCNKLPEKTPTTLHLDKLRKYHFETNKDQSIRARQTILLQSGRSLQVRSLQLSQFRNSRLITSGRQFVIQIR